MLHRLKQSGVGKRIRALVILLVFVGLSIFIYKGYQHWVISRETSPIENISREVSSGGKVGEETTEKLLSPKVYLSSTRLEQGDTLLIKINCDVSIKKITGRLGSTKLSFLELTDSKEWNWIGIGGIEVKKEPGKYKLVIDFPNRGPLKREIEIIERGFPVTKLLVTKELRKEGYTPAKIIENIMTKENIALKEVLDIYTPKARFNQAFVYPLEKIKNVGTFGNIRKSGEFAAQHLGVDLDASVGTPVFAINDGTVRFSKELTTYGKTLIIDHGLGIFSLYLHLSEFKVGNGDQVERGEMIALSGNTGYSITPHLHFSIKVNGVSVAPLKFVKTTEEEIVK